jgi:prepilin-type N-terminal cleavage/methylation domain-containing protein
VRTCGGFTLLELLIVIAIVSTLSVLGITNLPRGKFQVDEASRIVAGDLLRARTEAIKLNVPVVLSFNLASGSYTIFPDADRNWQADNGKLLLTRRIKADFPLVSFTGTAFANARTKFDVRGLPNLAGSLTMSGKGKRAYVRRVVMAAQGRVKVETLQ